MYISSAGHNRFEKARIASAVWKGGTDIHGPDDFEDDIPYSRIGLTLEEKLALVWAANVHDKAGISEPVLPPSFPADKWREFYVSDGYGFSVLHDNDYHHYRLMEAAAMACQEPVIAAATIAQMLANADPLQVDRFEAYMRRAGHLVSALVGQGILTADLALPAEPDVGN